MFKSQEIVPYAGNMTIDLNAFYEKIAKRVRNISNYGL
jgi:hypothetical protein